ncbi:cilia- and flagella-associated protein 206-like isoform X2 [Schistocerca gregaria]|uniref:cilia- and flagella-associated protein 206-like isoform X2 n=1 Tax=Schistocerca gregaria TaxID=7010 RepID=UPI00211DC968|nr:cilia- and flagella-associated protein 206-like isoform X2 [Schistocerca gregaria]
MSRVIQIENTIRNVVRETISKCADRGVHLSDALAQYVVELIALDPTQHFVVEDKPRKDIAEHLVQICVDKLCQKTPSLATLKMQVHFDTNFVPKANLVITNRTKRKQKTSVILKEISEITARTREALKKIYRKLVIAVTIYSGLGSPTNISVLQETSDALQSVFPLSELEKFLCLPHKEKEHRVTELSHIVAGIRLFNKDCERGGEGIENLPVMLQETITYLQESIQRSLHRLMELIYLLTLSVENGIKYVSCYDLKAAKESLESEDSGSDTETKKKPNDVKSADGSTEKIREEAASKGKFYDKTEKHKKDEGTHVNTGENGTDKSQQSVVSDEEGQTENVLAVAWQDMETIKDSLVAARQHEFYMRKLLTEVEASYVELKKWHLINIRNIVKFRTTDEIYPEFMKMSEAWAGLLDEKSHLENIKYIYWNLHSFMQVLETLDQDLLYALAGDTPILSDAQRMVTGFHIDPSLVKCEVIEPSKVSDIDQLRIQYHGFCAGMLVLGKGALIPGNPNLGLCVWKGLFYAFSSLEQAYEFGNNPDEDRTRRSKTVIKKNQSVQTELHPIPTYIDPNYIWNEWELKRNAVRLANICRSKTHSTQTYQSHKRSTIACQTTNKKTVSCQTKTDGSTNVPTLKNFIFGLRGRTDAQQYLVTLTRPVNE